MAADIATLKQALLVLVEHLRQSGVGALPLDAPSTSMPGAPATPSSAQAQAPGQGQGQVSDEQMIAEATRAVRVLYERQRRIQDGAGVVAGLLGQGLQLGTGAPGSGSGSQGTQGAGAGEGSQGSGVRRGGAGLGS